MKMFIVFIFLITLSSICNSTSTTKTTITNEQIFNEELLVKPLPNSKIYTHVQFTTEWTANFYDQSTFQHYDLFSRAIGDLVSRVGVEEMTLQFTQGRWNYGEWGYPVRSAPVGVELAAWIRPESRGVDAQWRELTHTLSGLFCASMQFLYQVPHHTSSPSISFRPEGESNIYHKTSESPSTMIPAILNLRDNATTPLQLRYGILPRESVCTENLTPWVKLLPCREQAGLGRLLNPLRLYDVHYHSMSITIRKICKSSSNSQSCDSPILESIQSISIVNDLKQLQSKLPGLNGNGDKIDVELSKLFGIQGGLTACPLASLSKIYIKDLKQEQENNKFDIGLRTNPEPNEIKDNFRVYDLTQYTQPNPLHLKLGWNRFNRNPAVSPITAHSHLTGYGQERGGIAIQIYNDHHTPLNITYYQAIPWYLRVYFHTFTFNINTQQQQSSTSSNSGEQQQQPTSKFYKDEDFSFKKVSPAETRSSPSTLEIQFELPAHSVASMSIEFDKVFLHYTEHPPDANRGFDLGSGVVTVQLDQSTTYNQSIDIEWSPYTYNHQQQQQHTNVPVRVYTEGLLITLPTPDFSMLYNVITLTGTVFALFFGSMINILIRRLKDTFTGEDFVSDRPIAKIYRKLMKFVDGK